MRHQQLDSSQFHEAVAAANLHFSMIQGKYLNLRGYLVLASRGKFTRAVCGAN